MKPPSGRAVPNLATAAFTSSATWPRSRPATPSVRSIVGCRLVWTISDGTVTRLISARFRSGIDFFWVGLVTGMSSRVSSDVMSASG